MKISKLKTMTNPNPVDVLLALDIDGGISQNPTLRLVTVASILSMIQLPENPVTQSAIEELENNLSSLGVALNDYIVLNNTNIQAIETLIQSLESNNGNDERLDALEATVNNLPIIPSGLVSQVDSLQSNYNGQANTMATLQTGLLDQQNFANFLNSQIVALTNRVNTIDIAIANIKLPTTFQHFHDTSKVVTGASLSRVQLAASIYVSQYQQSPASLNDSFSFSQLLVAGTYDLRMNVTKANNKGDLELRINGLLAFDDVSGYNSTVLHEDIIRTITIPSDGLHEFVFKVKGKNASSSNYFWLMSKVSAHKV